MTAPLRVELSWPAKELSPNENTHHMVLHRFKKAARIEAGWATRFVMGMSYAPPEAPIKVHFEAHPPKNWSTGDKDNLVARCKAHLDGIAKTIGVNDRDFDAPTVEWADKCDRGKLFVIIGG